MCMINHWNMGTKSIHMYMYKLKGPLNSDEESKKLLKLVCNVTGQ